MTAQRPGEPLAAAIQRTGDYETLPFCTCGCPASQGEPGLPPSEACERVDCPDCQHERLELVYEAYAPGRYAWLRPEPEPAALAATHGGQHGRVWVGRAA